MSSLCSFVSFFPRETKAKEREKKKNVKRKKEKKYKSQYLSV